MSTLTADRSTAKPTVAISPAFANLNPPLIVIGMHRSGTSMVVGMLQLLGVYMDPDMTPGGLTGNDPGERARSDGYGEAVAFRLANEAVMRRAGSDWQHVGAFLDRRDKPGFAAASVRQLAEATSGSLKTEFLDRLAGASPNLWGWKDPRTSLTLPYWLKLFPQARLLHIRRDTDAVVSSLMRRSTEKAVFEAATPPSMSSRLRNAVTNPEAILHSLRRRIGLTNPLAPMTRDDWRNLANTYVDECARHRDHAAGYAEISYESILNDPLLYAEQIARFTGSTASTGAIQAAAAFVHIDRKPKDDNIK